MASYIDVKGRVSKKYKILAQEIALNVLNLMNFRYPVVTPAAAAHNTAVPAAIPDHPGSVSKRTMC